ncbi:NAD-binding protein [Fomitiporia mediterranea MF3/22]|uniref:NAD-binding protein n=1 Tax=Fomitiporia mediterranea (strain MF3/22) TaxID=694068 RepID=UPI0004409205|nr:NAD-binding protein [Fomitiporia mediterranea MF3/22]EJD07987.1 NAD-binding protein [Fomitiporia mediterranea MF3/22]
MTTKVLVLGATGYIGGSVLVSLVKSHPNVKFSTVVRMSTAGAPDTFAAFAKQSNIDLGSNATTRSSSVADKFRAIGVETVIGSLDDLELVTRLSAESDIVINAADCDNVDLLNALLEGQKRRKAQRKPAGSIVHTSGAFIFVDNSEDGKFNANGKLWTDSEEDIRALTTSMPHCQVDVPLMKASEAGVVNSFIICPSGVYGTCTGPIERDSLIFRAVIPDYLSQKRAYYVGEGTNRYEWVHLGDLVSLFDKVFKLALDALSSPPATSPYERYYIASTTPVPWKDVSERLARELHKRGFIESPKPTVISPEGLSFLPRLLASSLNTRGFRGEEIGWKPKHITFSEEAFNEQVGVTLKSFK